MQSCLNNPTLPYQKIFRQTGLSLFQVVFLYFSLLHTTSSLQKLSTPTVAGLNGSVVESLPTANRLGQRLWNFFLQWISPNLQHSLHLRQTKVVIINVVGTVPTRRWWENGITAFIPSRLTCPGYLALPANKLISKNWFEYLVYPSGPFWL